MQMVFKGICHLVFCMKIGLSLTIILVLAGFSYYAVMSWQSPTTVRLFPHDGEPVNVKVELARTQEQLMFGLMNRTFLDNGSGMLFIFPDSKPRNFWMKNTLIPLDIIFFDENLTIVRIHHAVPCKSDPCRPYDSGYPVKFVLEVKAGMTGTHGLGEGDRAELKRAS